MKTQKPKVIQLTQNEISPDQKQEIHASSKFGQSVAGISGVRAELSRVLSAGSGHGSFHGVVWEMANLCGELQALLMTMRRMGSA